MERPHVGIWVLIVAVAGGSAVAQAPGRAGASRDGSAASAESFVKTAPDVPFVPTPDNVVAEMVRMADVRPGDVVYDLGSGDGRLLIAAVKQSGARGVGIDIDPQRIRESRQNARRAGVADRVRFRQGDFFTADIRPASVVMLYLLQDVNLKLRPKLLQELRPGARVVSHNYHMGDWAPAQHLRLAGHDVYCWVVPERVAGRR